jgi:RNA polymerase sigma-70 factor (ECF subfamily)
VSSDAPGETPALDHATSVFVGVRPRLYGIAYRMLDSVTEAEASGGVLARRMVV